MFWTNIYCANVQSLSPVKHTWNNTALSLCTSAFGSAGGCDAQLHGGHSGVKYKSVEGHKRSPHSSLLLTESCGVCGAVLQGMWDWCLSNIQGIFLIGSYGLNWFPSFLNWGTGELDSFWLSREQVQPALDGRKCETGSWQRLFPFLSSQHCCIVMQHDMSNFALSIQFHPHRGCHCSSSLQVV